IVRVHVFFFFIILIYFIFSSFFIIYIYIYIYIFIFSGVHRQALFITVGWFIGYHLTKYENYKYATLDRDMSEYIRLHPEEFPEKGNSTWKSSRISVLRFPLY
uniref:NADH dehydrogenase [ubiquinone] 1 subunit C2 n=1 Tax=Sinocyclocheilus anshuiensis TaxID=1608454 RepID=A0A671QPN2_9TELE